MKFFNALIGGKGSEPKSNGAEASGRPKPEQPLFVVGDIHGRADLLEKLLEKVDAAIGENELKGPKLVFTGNLIDHGPESARVLERLRELSTEFPENVVCLLGNHEQMLLDFLDTPTARCARWAKEGAAATFASYEVALGPNGLTPDSADAAAEFLKGALRPKRIEWLRARPSHLVSGNVHVVHAAADPRRAMDAQSARVLTWGHPEFLTVARTDGQWIVHGHTRVADAGEKDGRIAIDTGAWETGILTAAMILPNGTLDFVQTG
ncbi:MAG: metallophosphoesterase [Pseudomonadota bacterium]